jgi:putative tryptophan/tyrosine transport system substrate-binding protein
LSSARRAAWIVVLLASLMSPALAGAQTARPTARIGVVRSQPATDPMHQAFVAGLRERGWVEGRNLVIEHLQGDLSQFADLVRELIRRNVDVIVAPNPQQARIARDATSTIPIVFVVVGDPVGTGLIKSLAKPGGNVTGLTGLGSDLAGKRLEILKELVPRLTRVAVLMNPAVPDKRLESEHMQAAARELKLEVIAIEVRSPDDFRSAFQAITRVKPDGLIALAEPLVFANRQAIIDFARDARLPAMFAWRQAVSTGALVSYGPDIVDLHRRAAGYVDRILRGARPAELPVEQPSKFEFAVNLKTAKALDIAVPASILLRADQVVE